MHRWFPNAGSRTVNGTTAGDQVGRGLGHDKNQSLSVTFDSRLMTETGEYCIEEHKPERMITYFIAQHMWLVLSQNFLQRGVISA